MKKYKILLFGFIFLFINSASASERSDVDQNLHVNTTDAMLTLRNYLGLDMTGTGWYSSTATGDANCGGTVDLTDVQLILKKSLGIGMEGTGWCEGNVQTHMDLLFSRYGSDYVVDVGDSFINLGQFRLINDNDENTTVVLKSIKFKNDGNVNMSDSFENLSLYVDGSQVTSSVVINGNYINFTFINNYTIENNNSAIFSLRGDIILARAGDVLNLKLERIEDLIAVEEGTNFQLGVKSTDINGLDLVGTQTVTNAQSCLNELAEMSCARLRAYELDPGGLDISRSPTSLGNQVYAPGSNDVVFTTTRINVDQPIIVDGVRINTLSATNNIDITLLDSLDELNSNFINFRLYVNDVLIDSENQFSGTFGGNGVGTYLNFNTPFEITGTSILKLVGNVRYGAGIGSRLRMEVQSDAFNNPVFISTGEQVTDIQGSAQSSFVEIQE